MCTGWCGTGETDPRQVSRLVLSLTTLPCCSAEPEASESPEPWQHGDGLTISTASVLNFCTCGRDDEMLDSGNLAKTCWPFWPIWVKSWNPIEDSSNCQNFECHQTARCFCVSYWGLICFYVLQEHLQQCLFESVQCTNDGCCDQILRKDLKDHLSQHCKFREEMCQYCNKYVVLINIKVRL